MNFSFTFEQVPGLEMPSESYVKRFNFEMATEMMNDIKSRHMEMVERAWNSKSFTVFKVCVWKFEVNRHSRECFICVNRKIEISLMSRNIRKAQFRIAQLLTQSLQTVRQHE